MTLMLHVSHFYNFLWHFILILYKLRNFISPRVKYNLVTHNNFRRSIQLIKQDSNQLHSTTTFWSIQIECVLIGNQHETRLMDNNAESNYCGWSSSHDSSINFFCMLSSSSYTQSFHFLLTGTPINRLPIMAKSVLDLYELYNLVIARGGLVDVINKKLWQEIIKGLHLPSSITSAAFTLRTQ